ncbi:hypothetical protein DPMN_101252 [Dreissena polymorpha]|uniref:Uncharacterized protein n=1 Tax=Dreissena polymorpha TaxID=45954 RepID=A0A9D4LJ00_DREPO|nr:hypothetical protein DPMN_101252 [Dreissena polymorpha]
MYQSERTLDQQTIYFIIGGIRDSNLHAELSFLALTYNQLCWFPSNHCAEVAEIADVTLDQQTIS